MTADWLIVQRGTAPLLVSIPHAGTEIPEQYAGNLRSLWLARKDADWWLPQLYEFAEDLGATIVRTHISRTVVDVNRDPSGVSLYPGQITTGLCPVNTFDGEPLYRAGKALDEADIVARRAAYFEPYHAALEAEIERLRKHHARVVLYDCHSIRSKIPLLFDGVLPNFAIGTNDGKSCDPALAEIIAAICNAEPKLTNVSNGRFKGGYITRHYGNPKNGLNAIQMEIACRGYMVEPEIPDETNWPPLYDAGYAAPIRNVLQTIFESLLG